MQFKWEVYCRVSLSSSLKSQRKGQRHKWGGKLLYKLEVYCSTFQTTCTGFPKHCPNSPVRLTSPCLFFYFLCCFRFENLPYLWVFPFLSKDFQSFVRFSFPIQGSSKDCNGRALDRVTKQKHGPNRQKLSKKMSKNCIFSPSGQFFLDILSTFPFSGLSNDLPVTKQREQIFAHLGVFCAVWVGGSGSALGALWEQMSFKENKMQES